MAGFLHPEHLSFLPALIPLGLFVWLCRRRRLKALEALGVKSGGRSVPGAVLIFIVSSLILLALARPYWGFEEVEVKSSGQDVVAIVDISKSMLSRDASPSRLGLTKRKLHDLTALIEREDPGSRIGLVLFAGDSYLFCPPTSDYGVLRVYINSIESNLINSPGSDLRLAVDTAVKSLESSKASSPLLLLISDGEDLAFDMAPVLAQLKGRSLTLNAIGVGSIQGLPIELSEGRFVHDYRGNMVISRLNEENLSGLAKETGGLYLAATLDDADLKAIISHNRIKYSSGPQDKTRLLSYNEISPWLLLAALGIFLIAVAAGRPALIFTASFLLCFFAGTRVQAETSRLEPADMPDSAYAAAKAYNQGDFEGAKGGFEASLKKDPENLRLKHALASSLYRLHDYEGAAGLFEEIKKKAKTGREIFEALYNLGNSRLMRGDYKEAIKNYEEALEIKANDAKTLHNLELAKKLLKEQEKEPPPPKPTAEQEKRDSQEQQSSQSSPSASMQESEQSNGSGTSQAGEEGAGSTQSSPQSAGPQSERDSASQGGEQSLNQASSAAQESGAAQESSSAAHEEESGENSASSAGSASSRGQDEESWGESASAGEVRSRETELPAGGQKQSYDPTELKKEEARAWLDSLPDSPVLLMKKSGSRAHQSLQTW